MANSRSNTTLANLWVDDGQGSPIHVTPVTPSKSSAGAGESSREFIQFFKNSGLDSVAKDDCKQELSLERNGGSPTAAVSCRVRGRAVEPIAGHNED
ncbi:hypothetical protein PoB_000043200 [Plakobranchus ocellatus]|uniref:Uncharacterized protein n=1 Tax=Plakobranchus ocellatus TaxID=259542 RepID=A0AAV3XVQ2_9GAST|nr:hypothetical protein PoB_000043200 [Plakobranchus ocellatus]